MSPNYHDSVKSSKIDNGDEEFAFTDAMLEKAVADGFPGGSP
jgi:hypothetical protein